MDRPTIVDLARAAEVSVSTVDRVLNGRDPVRPATAERVLAAAEEIGFYATGLIRQRLGKDKPQRTLAFLLLQRSRTFYQMLGNALSEATKACTAIRGRPLVDYADDLMPNSVSDALARLGRDADAVSVVAADYPQVATVVDRLRVGGVPVFALISDLTAEGRAGYVGLDNLKAGRVAAWAIANMCKRPGPVGIIVGSHRFRCQDLNETGFRSYFRERAADYRLLEPITSLEDARYAHENTLDLLERNPDLVGLYVAGGGIRGVMQALRDAGPKVFGQIVTVAHDLTEHTKSGLADGVLRLVISLPFKRLAETTVDAMVRALDGPPAGNAPAQLVLPFDLHTAENL